MTITMSIIRNKDGEHLEDELSSLLLELSLLLNELRLAVENNASVPGLSPEQLRVILSQLLVLWDLSRSHGQVGCLRLESSLVGGVGDPVGVAVVSDELIAALLLEPASLGLGSRLETANFLHLKGDARSNIHHIFD